MEGHGWLALGYKAGANGFFGGAGSWLAAVLMTRRWTLWLRLFVFFLSKREEGAAATVLEKWGEDRAGRFVFKMWPGELVLFFKGGGGRPQQGKEGRPNGQREKWQLRGDLVFCFKGIGATDLWFASPERGRVASCPLFVWGSLRFAFPKPNEWGAVCWFSEGDGCDCFFVGLGFFLSFPQFFSAL